jgi:hypothetical protein
MELVQEPACPACRQKSFNFGHNIIGTPTGALVSIIWCSHCGHTIAMQYLGQTQNPAAGPRIIVPN